MMRPISEWKPVDHLPDDVRKVELTKRDDVKTAAQEFTSFFLSHLMQQQRKTIDKSELMDGGQGEQMFTGLLDQEYGKKLAVREDGLNGMLVNDWARGMGGYATIKARSTERPPSTSLHTQQSALKAYGGAK